MATQRQHWNDHFNSDFSSFAHDHKITPERADSGADWTTWLILGGAFAATLAARGVQRIPMLFQHDPSEPVGVWLELREDSRGLFARGRLISEVARARELLSLLRAGAIDGLSIGFRTVKGNIDPRSRVRRLVAVELWEISIVTFPLLAGARVRAVKAAASSSQVCRPALSHVRTRAERDWAKMIGAPPVAAVSRVRPAPRRQLHYRRLDGTVSCGSLRAWRQAL